MDELTTARIVRTAVRAVLSELRQQKATELVVLTVTSLLFAFAVGIAVGVMIGGL